MTSKQPLDYKAELSRMEEYVERALKGEVALHIDPVGDPVLDSFAKKLNLLIDRNNPVQSHHLQEAFFERVFNVLPAEVVIFDKEFRYLYINPRAVQDPEMRRWMIGKNDLEYCEFRGLEKRVAEERLQLYNQAIESGEAKAIYQEMKDRNGISRQHFRYLTPVFNQDGGVEMLIGYSLEVTAMWEQEKELREQKRALEKTSKELDQFVYRASHDLRSPLVSIMGLMDLIRMESPSASITAYLEMIQSRTSKLDLVIRDIVNFSKNSDNALEITAVDPLTQVEEVIQNLKNNYATDRIRIEKDIKSDCGWYSDPFRVNLLLSNLVSNAVKFQRPNAKDPFVRINIHITPLEAVLEVEDNGIGIPQDFQGQVFEMFFRATYKGAGAGIGLYLVQEVLEKLDGKIELKSKEGEGASFRVSIPNFSAPVAQA